MHVIMGADPGQQEHLQRPSHMLTTCILRDFNISTFGERGMGWPKLCASVARLQGSNEKVAGWSVLKREVLIIIMALGTQRAHGTTTPTSTRCEVKASWEPKLVGKGSCCTLSYVEHRCFQPLCSMSLGWHWQCACKDELSI
jgi:hypothetical protein